MHSILEDITSATDGYVGSLPRVSQCFSAITILRRIARSAGTHVVGTVEQVVDGIGILSKEKPLDIQTFPLPGREEERMLMVAEFKDYFFACTHLSLTEEDRLASLDIIKQSVSTSQKPFFLAGDLNDTPDSKFIQSLQTGI